MKTIITVTVLAAAFALSACGSADETSGSASKASESAATGGAGTGAGAMDMNAEDMAAMGQGGAAAPDAAAATYSAEGTVQSVADDQVTIAHGPVEGLGWPAMTMSFRAAPDQLAGLAPGAKVRFTFAQEGGSSVIKTITPAT